MAGKDTKRVIHGTCVVVETAAASTADELPSKVRVTLQRPRGGCLGLGKRSSQVAKFTFFEGPCSYRHSHALLSLEKLFKYSNKEDTQIKIFVEQRRGGKHVARVPLQEYMKQLLCTGRCEWVFLYIHGEKVTLMPSNCPSHNDVPEWAFEGIESAPKEERRDERHLAEEGHVIVGEIMNDILDNIDRHVQIQELIKGGCVSVPEYECASVVTSDDWAILQISSHEEKKLTYKNETFPVEQKNEEDTANDCITEVESLCENSDEEHDYDDHITDNHQERDSDRITDKQPTMTYDFEEMADGSISPSRLLLSRHGAVIVLCFITLTVLFEDILQDGAWGWGWRGALLMLSFFNLTRVLLDFFRDDNQD